MDVPADHALSAEPHRVVVVGGGFGGLPACRFLAHVDGGGGAKLGF